MLGASYLFSISLQHYLLLGFLVLFWSEIRIQASETTSFNFFYTHMSLLGLSILNLALMYYAFTEDLLLIQVLLSFAIISLLAISSKAVVRYIQPEESCAYIFLAVFLFFELAT